MKQLSMFINGQFVAGSGEYRDVINPSSEAVIAKEPVGNIDDVNRAVAAAKKAQKSWERMS